MAGADNEVGRLPGPPHLFPAEPLLHPVQHVVDQSGAFGLRAGETKDVAAGAGLPCDRQALAQLQEPAGAAGGGVGGLSQHILKDGAEGGPLGLAPLAHDGVEGGCEEVLVPGLEGGGEGVELAGGEVGRVGEEGAEGLDHADMVADAGAGGAGEGGEEGGDGGVGGVEVALMDGVEDEGGLLPRGDGFADLVLGHHAGEGLGDGLGGAEEGGDRGVAQGAAGGEAAEAGDEAVGVAVGGVERRQTSMGVRRPSVAMECWRRWRAWGSRAVRSRRRAWGAISGMGRWWRGSMALCSFGGREAQFGLGWGEGGVRWLAGFPLTLALSPVGRGDLVPVAVRGAPRLGAGGVRFPRRRGRRAWP